MKIVFFFSHFVFVTVKGCRVYTDIPVCAKFCGFLNAVITPFIEPCTRLLVKIVVNDKHEFCNGRQKN